MDKQLQEYEQSTLSEISPLMVTSIELKAKADSQKIESDDDLKAARETTKEINAHAKFVKERRLELTKPADDFKSTMIAKETEILSPLEQAKKDLSAKIVAYAEEQERVRLIEEQRIDGLVAQVSALYKPGMTMNQVETGRAAAKKLIADLGADAQLPRVKVALLNLSNRFTERAQDIQVEEQRAKKQKLQADQDKIDAENRRIEAEKARQQAERERQEADAAARAREAARPKANIHEVTEIEITDADTVAREFCSPDLTKLRAYIKQYPNATPAGVKITKRKESR